MLHSIIGFIISVKNADANKIFNLLSSRLKLLPKIINVIIILALIAEGDAPVIRVYIQMQGIHINPIYFFLICINLKKLEINKKIAPTCSPDTAKRCTQPVIVNRFFVSELIVVLSPIQIALIIALTVLSLYKESILEVKYFCILFVKGI